MGFHRLMHAAAWHLRMDADLRRLGLPAGTFFSAFYWARLRAAISSTAAASVAKPVVVRHRVSGQRATLHIRTGPDPADLSDWIVLRGIWADHDYFHPLMTGCHTVLDVGANVGIAAVWLKALIPVAELACVEPDPRNLPLARLNLAENSISARIFECAVAPQAGRARLGIEKFKGKSSLENAGLHSHREFVEVQTRRIPEILDDLGWSRVDLLKMDIEGMERDILANGGDWLDRAGLIVMEVHENTSPEELSRLLHPHGWTLQRLGVHDEATYLAMPTCRPSPEGPHSGSHFGSAASHTAHWTTRST
jgi:FkbM family methyltransferase